MEWSEIMQANILQKGVELSEKADRLRRQGIEVYPPQDKIFQALKLTAPDKVKVCIIGQDPYHSPGVANGLAFSISSGRRIQPSLRNIFKELYDDTGCPVPGSGFRGPDVMGKAGGSASEYLPDGNRRTARQSQKLGMGHIHRSHL